MTSLLIATVASRFDRRNVLMGLTGIMLASLVLIAEAPNFLVLMAARALLGIVIGGFWSLATATVMRLVPENLFRRLWELSTQATRSQQHLRLRSAVIWVESSAGAASSVPWHLLRL